MDVGELERRFTAAVAAFPLPVRRELARVLELNNEARASDIGRLHQWGGVPELAELLIDLEEDERVRRLVLSELHRQAHA